MTQATADKDQEIADLRRQLAAAQARNGLCDHECDVHKRQTLTAEEKAAQVEQNKMLDRIEKDARVREDDGRLDALVKLGKLERGEATRLKRQYRETLGVTW